MVEWLSCCDSEELVFFIQRLEHLLKALPNNYFFIIKFNFIVMSSFMNFKLYIYLIFFIHLIGFYETFVISEFSNYNVMN